jgi:type IV pilus assembly protein PilM
MVDWKKEYKVSDLFKRDRAPVAEDASLVEPQADAPAVPWYKKEVSLKRKAPAAPKARASEPQGEPVVPWYRKEVSLKRKAPAAAGASGAEPQGERVPWYKKEISLKREPAVEPLPESPPLPLVLETPIQSVQLPPVDPEPELAPVAEPLPEPVPVAEVLPEPEPTIRALPDPEPEPPVAAVEPAPAEPVRPVSWVDAVLDARMPAPAPAAEPEPAREPVAATPEPEPEPEPEPRPIHPPVTADELPPLEGEPQPSVPWYKRELSFGRKPKEQEPFELDIAPKRPFWKRELSLGRSAKQPEPETAAAAPAAEPDAKSVPFWKKELSFGRSAPKEKAPKQPKAEKPDKQEQPAAAKPFWKRELSLNVSLPQRGGSGKGAIPKQVVGLKIGASQIAAARVANNGHAEVLQVARQPLDQGVIVGGELRDPEALALVLKDFFRRHKLPRRGVRLGIANNRIGVRTFEIAGIDDAKQLANAIRFRAQEALPIPIEDAVLDYQVLTETVNEEGEKVRKILLVVAYRELVDRYVLACRKAGIALVGIDLEAFALLRALAAPREEQDGAAAVVAVAVGHDRSTFAVSDGRVCEFTRVLEWGGQNLNVAIARALDVTPSEAEPVKHLLSLEGGPAPEGVSEEQLRAAREAALGQVNTFARELVSSLQFYQSQPGSLGIGEIIVTGGTAHLDGFAVQLQRLIGVKVRIGDPLVRVKVPKRFQEPEQIGSLAVAIGLGIED